MSNSFYEDTLLRQEFNLVAKLQQYKEFSDYVSVSYEDRMSGNVQSVSVQPTGPRYPEKYIVEYKMPVYVSQGKLRRDWHGTATILLSEPVLTNKHSHQAPHVTFHSDFTPFNNHVRRDSICSGNAWAVARDNGLWHFIISLGALINQDEFVCAEGGHFNREAYDYWLTREQKPITNIKWPLDLLSRPDFVVTQTVTQDSTVKIVQTVPEKPDLGITRVPDRPDIKITAKTAPLAPMIITPKKG
jgi:hypothetical protein